MVISRFNPWRELAEFQEGIMRALEEDFPALERKRGAGEWFPRVDVVENEKEIVLYFDLPGVDQKEVEVVVSEDRLTVSGERKNDNTGKNFLRQERTFGPFRRSFVLRIPVNVEQVMALYKNGVLEIHVPKFEGEKTRKITVQES